MTDEGNFLVYCAEIYKDNKGISGKELTLTTKIKYAIYYLRLIKKYRRI